ncbi:hypothetical protein JOD51_003048 [Curtobacterium herbarum]|nr:hypothetical protein [Curtobacterium herbarum]
MMVTAMITAANTATIAVGIGSKPTPVNAAVNVSSR